MYHCILSYTILNVILYNIPNITLPQLHYNQNVAYFIVSYIMYDICNLIFCMGKFHIRRIITPMDQMNAK
jgi:hypothetical protein